MQELIDILTYRKKRKNELIPKNITYYNIRLSS